MRRDIIAVAIILFLCISLSLQYPSEPTCYNQICPAGTTSCKKNIKSSWDRRNLETRITCLDDFNGSLKEYYFEEPSEFRPNTHYESSSYSAAGGVGDNSYYRGNNDVEDFAR